jgi:hypothetical protein
MVEMAMSSKTTPGLPPFPNHARNTGINGDDWDDDVSEFFTAIFSVRDSLAFIVGRCTWLQSKRAIER